ncbi:type III-B CRISPR module RAMP protein Cmr4 [Saccharolobus solfataricus]|uniref:type III-B CRISPR module RAMP protein Cmr4 n=1 Tax=Saccharolobus solfataricus TaxID=2287 RepID=UPI000B30DC17
MHVSSGTSVEEEVDLPFQRDELNYPTIFASSLKGAIKSFLLKEYSNAREIIYKVLGSDENPDEASLGSFLDAVLFAIPARSIGVSGLDEAWVYVTTYELLRKVKSLLESMNTLSATQFTSLLDAINNILQESKNLIISDNAASVILNEDFYVELSNIQNEYIQSLLGDMLIENSTYNQSNQNSQSQGNHLVKPLIVLKDSIGREVINRSLIRVRRIKIKRSSKTVEEGGLWSEEYVPVNSLFFSSFLARGSKDTAYFADCILRKTRYLILGGKETIGKGIVELRWLND